jgi:hypothetical protein
MMILIGMIAVTLAWWLGAPDPLAYVIGSAVVLETLILPADGPAPHWLACAATAIAVLWVRFAWCRHKSVAPQERWGDGRRRAHNGSRSRAVRFGVSASSNDQMPL